MKLSWDYSRKGSILMVFRCGIGMNDVGTTVFRHLVASLNKAQVFWNVPTLLAQQQLC